MRINRVKQKLKRGQPSIGTWLSSGHFQIARLLARCGFDWLTLDMEHAPYDWREVATLLATIADAGCVPLVRVPDGSHTSIKRALDAGAFGVVIPMVENVEQAQAAIAAAKYPPVGNRSAGGGMHNMNFDCSVEEYYEAANDQIMVVLQTESPLGISNAKEIYSLPGCDAIFIGPNDLKFQMRHSDGSFPTPEEHEKAIQRIVAAGRDVRLPIGMHVLTTEQANQRIGQGMQFVAISSDLGMLAGEAHRISQSLGLVAKADVVRY